MEKMIPTTIKIAHIKIDGNGKKNVFKYAKLLGIKSVQETVNITPAAKASEIVIIVDAFNFLKKIGIAPIKVDAPAIVVSKNAYIILFILSPTTSVYEKKTSHMNSLVFSIYKSV